jgi:hypothetical protein
MAHDRSTRALLLHPNRHTIAGKTHSTPDRSNG